LKLKNIANIRTGLVLSRKKASLHNEFKKNYEQITLKSFSNSTSLITKYFDKFISNENINDDYISQVGDIVVRLREPNVAAYIDEKSSGKIISSLMAIIRVTNNSINKKYLAHYLNSTPVKRSLQLHLKGTTISMIKTKDLGNIDIVLPTIQKQDAVVNLLQISQEELVLINQLKEQKENFALRILDTVINQTKKDNKNAKN